jgi:hypothetical protein
LEAGLVALLVGQHKSYPIDDNVGHELCSFPS